MFASLCGHLLPAHGGTRAQFGATSDSIAVTRCQYCHQLFPSTAISSSSSQLPSPSLSIPIDPQLPSTSQSSYSLTSAPQVPIRGKTSESSSIGTVNGTWGHFKAASFHNALLTAQKGGRASHIAVGTRRPPIIAATARQNMGRGKHRKPQISEVIPPEISASPQTILSPLRPRRYNLMLIISHEDTPFKIETIPDMEEWIPTDHELQTETFDVYLTSAFGSVIRETGLWDTLITLKPDCKST